MLWVSREEWDDLLERVEALKIHHRDLAEVKAGIGHLMNLMEKIMVNTDALVTAAARAKKDSADLLAALTSIRNSNKDLAAQLQAVKDQLAALPVDTSAQEAAIAGVVADLNKMADDTEAAVAANPAVQDMPPAPTA